MTTSNEQTSTSQSPEVYLQNMQEEIDFTPNLPERSKWFKALKFIPLLTGLGNNIIGTGSGIAQLLAIGKNISSALRFTSHALAHGFQYSGIALALLDFIRIPAMYGAAWIMGEKSPVTLPKNARWFYSALLLGLAITALAVPATAAPIALITGVMGVGVSLFTLAWFLKRRHEVQQSLKKVDKKIEYATQALKDLKQKAKELSEHGEKNQQEIKLLHDEFSQLKTKLYSLHEQKARLLKKQQKRNTAGLVDKSVGVGLSSLALAGLVVYLFAPPAGIGLMIAAAGMGTLYITARVATSWIKKLCSWIGQKLPKPKEEAEEENGSLEKQEQNQEEATQTMIVQMKQAKNSTPLPNGKTDQKQTVGYSEPTDIKNKEADSKIPVIKAGSREIKKEAKQTLSSNYSFFSSFPFKLPQGGISEIIPSQKFK